jgi:hypothetical protein
MIRLPSCYVLAVHCVILLCLVVHEYDKIHSFWISILFPILDASAWMLASYNNLSKVHFNVYCISINNVSKAQVNFLDVNDIPITMYQDIPSIIL